jgi:hypothetical protein
MVGRIPAADELSSSWQERDVFHSRRGLNVRTMPCDGHNHLFLSSTTHHQDQTMNRFLPFLALLAFVFASCDSTQSPVDPAAPASKATVYKDVEIGGDFYNECCDELITLDGIGTVVVRDNGLHFKVSEMTGTGVGSGNIYTIHNTLTQNESFTSGNGAQTYTLTVSLNMINENGCSFKLKMTVHVTVNANGDVTSEVSHIETTCE